MPRRKKYSSLDTAALDPMTAAILAGLKPHINAAVRDQIATILLDVLAKVAPERLANALPVPAIPTPVPAQRSVEKPSEPARK